MDLRAILERELDFQTLVFPLYFMHFKMRRQCQPEMLQQDCLMFCRLCNAFAADVDAAFGRHYNVHHLYLRSLLSKSKAVCMSGQVKMHPVALVRTRQRVRNQTNRLPVA
jgi:hypothetical protein